MPESTTHVSDNETTRLNGGASGAGQLLQHRLDLIEDLWKTVLRSECPPEQSERLLRLKQLSDPVSLEGRDGDSTSEAIVELPTDGDRRPTEAPLPSIVGKGRPAALTRIGTPPRCS